VVNCQHQHRGIQELGFRIMNSLQAESGGTLTDGLACGRRVEGLTEDCFWKLWKRHDYPGGPARQRKRRKCVGALKRECRQDYLS
jgi:hypothetical protein